MRFGVSWLGYCYLKSIIVFTFAIWLWFLFVEKSRVAPDTPAELIEYFLDTEAQEIEFEIARLRPQLVL